MFFTKIVQQASVPPESPWLTAGIAFGSILAGFAFRVLWERYSESFCSPSKLLEKLGEGNLGKRGRKRLDAEASEELGRLRDRFPAPLSSGGGKALCDVPDSFVLRSEFDDLTQAACSTFGYPEEARPIVLRLQAGKESIEDQYRELIRELRKALESVCDEPAKRKLLAEVKPPGSATVVWLVCPHLLCRAAAQAQAALIETGGVVRTFIRDARVILELCLAADIANSLRKRGRSVLSAGAATATIRQGAPPSSAASYAYERNKVTSLIGDGLVLDQGAPAERSQVPHYLLRLRISQALGGSLEGRQWTTIAITGPPGAGKSDLAALLLQDIAVQERAVVLRITTPAEFDLLHSLPRDPIESGRHALSVGFARLPGGMASASKLTVLACQDVLKMLLDDAQTLVILAVDNLDHHDEARLALEALRDAAAQWHLRFVLIGRGEIEPRPPEMLIPIRCDLWSKTEAGEILNAWQRTLPVEAVGEALAHGWFGRCDTFSLYTLQLAASAIAKEQVEPGPLLRETIREHCRLLEERTKSVLAASSADPALVLGGVEELIARSGALVPKEEIVKCLHETRTLDLLEVLGMLSWASLYGKGEKKTASLDRESVQKWAGGAITGEERARTFLAAGQEAGVFLGHPGAAYTWHDKLIGDGCAALYLAGHSATGEASTLAKMVFDLDKANSIEILTLALDVPILRSIVTALIGIQRSDLTGNQGDYGRVMDRLLSPRMLARFQADMAIVDGIFFDVYSHAKSLRNEQSWVHAGVLDRLAALHRGVLGQYIIEEADHGAELAVSVQALRNRNSTFFETVRHDRDRHEKHMRAAGLVWELREFEVLAAAFVDAVQEGLMSGDGLARSALALCVPPYRTRRELLQFALGVVDCALATVGAKERKESMARVVTRTGDQVLGSVLRIVLRGALGRGHAKEGPTAVECIKRIGLCATSGLSQCASELTEYLVRLYDPDLAGSGSNWRVENDGEDYVIPTEPRRLASFAEVSAVLYAADRVKYCRLPSTGELKKASGAGQERKEGGQELVGDRLPKDYKHGDTVDPSTVVTWDGNTARPVLRKAIKGRERFDWRPRIALKSLVSSE